MFEIRIFGKIVRALNEPKMILNAVRSKVPILYSASICDSQISLRYTVQWTLIETIEVKWFSYMVQYWIRTLFRNCFKSNLKRNSKKKKKKKKKETEQKRNF